MQTFRLAWNVSFATHTARGTKNARLKTKEERKLDKRENTLYNWAHILDKITENIELFFFAVFFFFASQKYFLVDGDFTVYRLYRILCTVILISFFSFHFLFISTRDKYTTENTYNHTFFVFRSCSHTTINDCDFVPTK